MWDRVEQYLAEFGFRPQVGENEKAHDYYIPENIFYRLCMKAKNEVAEKFQAKVADEIIPSIRKNFFSDLFRGSDLDVRPTNVVWTKKEADGLHILSASNGHPEWFRMTCHQRL